MTRIIKAIIPVRSGSIRVQNKNLRPFCGSNLLEIRAKQLMQVKGLSGVCVSSNDDEMLAIAADLGCETHRRDPYFASNSVPMSEVYANMASEIECDDVMHATVTTPLVKSESYEQAIALYTSDEFLLTHDSLSTTADVKEFLIKDGLPLNFDPMSVPRSQDLPDIQRLTFAISILPRTTMIERKNNLGARPYFMKLSQTESLDIDTPLDFQIAEYLYRTTVLESSKTE